jgi:hypothetical protein
MNKIINNTILEKVRNQTAQTGQALFFDKSLKGKIGKKKELLSVLHYIKLQK